jgi:hypothetical protein
MDLFKSIISAKADPDQCYFYIDDDRTIRLDKLLDLPNSFDAKRGQITEKEKTEKLKREAMEIYYMKANNSALAQTLKAQTPDETERKIEKNEGSKN